MQSPSNVRRNSTASERKSINESTDDSQPPPPSYPSVIHKLENFPLHNYNDQPPPPSYADLNNPSVIYINNYPGPPLTDGVVQIVTSNQTPSNQHGTTDNILSKRMQVYLWLNGIFTIIFGISAIGIQIGLVASHSIVYYYYGFWAGILIISIGIGTLLFNNRYRRYETTKYFRSFVWQTAFIAVVFGFGIIIILTDSCDGEQSENDGNDDACKRSYKVLNGLLIAVISIAFVQSIINTIIIAVLKRRYMTSQNAAIAAS
ncbi:unnamed protein product [Adineta ricciae]|uniref:Uncharacterized protein n=1 Tax=Adineta ricciae TaxID=249248 RepID=A0A815U9W8_ADIRI|nr:unnamed protein product [Adineta ricciae]CAF1516639.1 unnamed protein product [Adineta ricciae]